MIFMDIEAFKHYWCVVCVDEETETRHVFEDVPSLREYYKENRHRTWIGYNIRQYDVPMIKFIMLGLDPYECSQELIVYNRKWFQWPREVTEMYKRIPLRAFDCVLLNKGLKKLEGFRGSSIKESSIPWDYDELLTRAEKDEIIDYCTHDVLETRKVFYDTKEEYDAHEALVKAFELADVHFNKTKAQLAAYILGAEKRDWYDEWEFELPTCLNIERYTHVVDWYVDSLNHDYSKSLKTTIAGVPHVFGWGGLHGAKPKYSDEGFFVNMDVASYYPAMLIEYGLVSRSVRNPEKFKQIRDDRLVLKKNKDPKQFPYKIVINAKSGAMKDKYNPLYDPRNNNSMCVGGQLLLLDLIEKLEDHCDIVQSNTDGVMVKLRNDSDYDKIVSIGQEWSKRVKMELEFDKFTKVFQKDVNNYLIVPDGHLYKPSGMPTWKCKGAWLKEWYKEVERDGKKVLVQDYTEYDLVIVKEALHNYFVLGKPIEDTINECTELRKFQKIVMVSRKYDYAVHGNEELRERHLRVFASFNEDDKGIMKFHAIKRNLNKVADTPLHAFIVNEDVTQAHTDDYPLDREYYIKMAKDRVKAFGIKEVKYDNHLDGISSYGGTAAARSV